MDVRNLSGKKALVTGAASGIGRALALELAGRGADLAICDVDEGGLKATEDKIRALGRKTITQRVDVSKPQEMEGFARAVHGQWEAVDVLVNNAGVGLGAEFLDTELQDWEWILGINLKGVIYGCHFFAPQMVQRGHGGHVVNIASMAAFIPFPPLCAYNVTKGGVVSLSESLRSELRPHGIGVTAVCPGVIATSIADNMRYRGASAGEEARRQSKELMLRRGYTPERAARNILKAVARNRAVAPIALEAWIAYYLKRAVPRFVLWAIHVFTERQKRRLEAQTGA
jgi:NAD(P)-dependent dehydrogenase (short-subunit alcohol dehydrogenase family)